AGLVAAGLMALLPLADPGMVFLAAVLLTAVLAGLGPSILAAVLGLLVYDFVFVEPRFTLTVAKPQDILSMVMFLVVAVLTGELTARVRDQAEAARRREERTAALYAFAREIAGSADLDDLVRVILDHVARLFGTGAALLLPDAGRLVLRAIRPASGRRRDRKSTRLNSSHRTISYAVFCLKKKKKNIQIILHIPNIISNRITFVS